MSILRSPSTVRRLPAAAGIQHRHELIARAARWLRAGCALACLALGAVAGAAPQVTISPTRHDFGIQLLGTRSAPFTGLLTNTGTGPMTVEAFDVGGFRTDGGWVQTGTCQSGLMLDTGQSCMFSVTFSPGTVGEHLGWFCIVVPEAHYFDCNSTLVLRGTGVQQAPYAYFQTPSRPGNPPYELDMGRADLGVPGPVKRLGLQNLGLENLVVTRWEITGDNPSDFLLGSECGAGTSLPAGSTCQVDVRFRPTASGKRLARLTVYTNGDAPFPTVELTGTTTGIFLKESQLVFGTPRPGSQVFGRLTVGNDSLAALTVTGALVGGAHFREFSTTGCVGQALAPGDTCTLEVAYTRADAASPGSWIDAQILVESPTSFVRGPVTALLGTIAMPGISVRVLEYYDAARDHYFIASTNQLTEVRDLDAGVHAGWARTGKSFYAFAEYGNPVCRFYIPPGYGDSHFYSASTAECQETAIRLPQLVYESPNVFGFLLPDGISGACPAATVPVYRLWNNRADSNHRYTTETSVVDQMVAKGWRAEGYGPGPYLPVACAPPPLPTPPAN